MMRLLCLKTLKSQTTMSTNINSNNLPDVSSLEKLANELFLALPGNFPGAESLREKLTHSTGSDTSLAQAERFNIKDPQTSLHNPQSWEPQQPLPSGSGIGISPSVLQHTNAIDVQSLQNLIPGESYRSGHTPYSIDQGNAVNVSNPQTSFAEPKHESRGIPASLSGSGISPSALHNGQHTDKLPNVHEQAYGSDLTSILTSINTFELSPQLPLVTDSSSFYFLSETRQYGTNEKVNQHKHTSVKEVHTPSGILAKPFDVNLIKKDFPILQERVNGKPLIWLDNAATTQKPKQVIDRISYFYEHENSNIHRAAHELAARATDAYESARQKVQTFINAGSINEIIFVRGATEGINLIAKSWGEQNLQSGDEIIVSHLEHHANIVPWQQLAAKKGLKLRVIPVDEDGQIILEEYAKLLNPRTKLVSFTQVSNALGTVTPAKKIIELAHQSGAKVLVDGAQSISHMRVDVRNLNCDWFIFSGHKVFGPTGIGVVYGKEDLLNETNPWQGGGNMIVDVTFEHTTYHKAPGRFEAGTGNIADAVGLGAALDYVSRLGIDVINQYEHYLLVYATKLLKDIPGLKLIGTAEDKASVLSFVFDGYKTEEVGAALNQEGIAVRSGHHCAQPILRRFGLEATVRPSLAFYNTCSDIDVLVETLYRLRSGHKRAVR
jgi:cysteine desulfurase/selenocysteine lyase